MRKLGRFKGLEVFILTPNEWSSMTTKDDEKFYVVEENVFYHDVKVARLNEYGELCSLDENEIIALRKRYDALRAEGNKKEVAEMRPMVEDKVETPVSDPAAAIDIDHFLKHGMIDIDGYIENAKQFAIDLEAEYAAG
jgi:hypothetical protein